MRIWMAASTGILPLLLCACDAPQAASVAPARPATPAQVSPTGIPAVEGAPSPSPPPADQVVSRTIEKDLDADGIADYRVTFVETFDSAGTLVSRTRAEDFEADGIIDTRVTTSFRD